MDPEVFLFGALATLSAIAGFVVSKKMDRGEEDHEEKKPACDDHCKCALECCRRCPASDVQEKDELGDCHEQHCVEQHRSDECWGSAHVGVPDVCGYQEHGDYLRENCRGVSRHVPDSTAVVPSE